MKIQELPPKPFPVNHAVFSPKPQNNKKLSISGVSNLHLMHLTDQKSKTIGNIASTLRRVNNPTLREANGNNKINRAFEPNMQSTSYKNNSLHKTHASFFVTTSPSGQNSTNSHTMSRFTSHIADDATPCNFKLKPSQINFKIKLDLSLKTAADATSPTDIGST